MSLLTNQVVLITGCSSGIGEAMAQEFFQRGHRVVATARKPETIDGDESDRWLKLKLDVTNQKDIKKAISKTLEWAGRIDILVNNAGYALIGPVAELRSDELSTQLNTNVTGPVALIHAVIPHMVSQRSGRIVNIGSVSGIATTPYAGAYCASKAAFHSLSEALRLEVAPFGIDVITVQPGAISSRFGHTASSQLDRYRDPESLYFKVAEFIEARAQLSQEKATSAEEFSRRLADKVTAPRPPIVARIGRGSRLLPLVGSLPRILRDRIMNKRFGLENLR